MSSVESLAMTDQETEVELVHQFTPTVNKQHVKINPSVVAFICYVMC